MKNTQEDISGIFKGRCKRMIFKHGSTIFTSLERANYVFYIYEGCVRLSATNRTGNESIIFFAFKDHLVGAEATIADCNYGITAVAIEKTETYAISREQFNNLLNNSLVFNQYVLNFLALKIREMGRHIMNLTLQDSYGKIAQTIVDQAHKKQHLPSAKIPNSLCLTHNDLGNYLGLSRSTVTSTLNFFENENIIEKKRNLILIKSEEDLKKWLK